MSALQQLAASLGGVVHTTPRADWLDTSIGDLRAVVIVRASCHELGVFTPGARELVPGPTLSASVMVVVVVTAAAGRGLLVRLDL